MAFIVLFSIASAGLVAGSSLPAFIRIAGAVSFAAIACLAAKRK